MYRHRVPLFHFCTVRKLQTQNPICVSATKSSNSTSGTKLLVARIGESFAAIHSRNKNYHYGEIDSFFHESCIFIQFVFSVRLYFQWGFCFYWMAFSLRLYFHRNCTFIQVVISVRLFFTKVIGIFSIRFCIHRIFFKVVFSVRLYFQWGWIFTKAVFSLILTVCFIFSRFASRAVPTWRTSDTFPRSTPSMSRHLFSGKDDILWVYIKPLIHKG